MDSFDDTFEASAQDSLQEGEVFVNEDVPRLIRRWRNEKYAPELLPFDKEVVQNMSEMLQFVAENLEEDRAEADGQDPNDSDFCLRNLDLERMRFILRDYLRIRLWKLTQWPQHYMEPSNQEFLSQAERTFLTEFWLNKKLFLDNRLLGALPPTKQSLLDKIDLLDMIRRPVLDKHVYARINMDLGQIDVPPSLTQETEGTQIPLVLNEGETYLLKYNLVRRFLVQEEDDAKVDLV